MQLNRSGKRVANFVMPIDDLRRRFALDNKYNRFCDLKSRVLEPARKEINKYSTLKIKYEAIKRGRTPKEIEFHVERKKEESVEKSKKLTRKEIEAKALPGETWEEARSRLEAESKRCPKTIDMFDEKVS